MTKIIGLTGGIASGKTTISNYFRSLNIPVIDADLIAREVMRAGEPAVIEIRKAFGSKILLPDGEIDRKLLGEMIFKSTSKRQQLNAIVQKRIREKIKKEIKSFLNDKYPLIVLDIPLLYEENYEKDVDEVMVVFVDTETQKIRLLKRNQDLSELDALNRINSQMPLLEKADRADVVIDNNDTLAASLEQVSQWLEEEFGIGIFELN